MTSPLAGSLARTIGKAMASIFLPATLTRGTTVYPCKAIYEERNSYQGTNYILKGSDFTILVLATSLAAQPEMGDIVTLQDFESVVLSNDAKPAVSIDPAGAVWTLRTKVLPASGGLQDNLNAGYAAAAAAMGTPFALHRSTGSNPLSTTPLTTLPAVFTNAKSSGFSFDKTIGYEDALWAVLADAGQLQVGDYLVGSSIYFIAAMPPLLPVVAVLCTRIVTVTRPNSERNVAGGQAQGLPSQPGGAGRYRGVSQVVASGGPGETIIASGIPAWFQATAGRATGTGELPSDSPGPARWRIDLPPSGLPKGSMQDRYVITDEEGNRHQVTAAPWTPLGYRVEAIRLEN